VSSEQRDQSVAVVVGASSGIGRATAQALAHRGAQLVLAARSEDSLAEVAAECATTDTLTVTVDAADEASVESLIKAAVAHFGRVDVVVNTAAVVAYGKFEDVPAGVFRRVIEVNLIGSANVARASLHQFRRQGTGTLVLVGSLLGKIVTPYMSSYVVSKWGVRALARALAIETRNDANINVVTVSPGSIDTPIYTQAANYTGRIGRPPPPIYRPENVATAIVRSIDNPRGRRDRSVGSTNGIIELGFGALPAVYDLLVGPLMRLAGLSRRKVAPHEGNVFEPQPSGDELRRDASGQSVPTSR
jgi:NAD(P)-dependent dehydrogenase (short-subunit alcohol dehydrogenase family)